MQQAKETSSPDIGCKLHAPRALVVIGASTGGPTALAQILPKFPRNFGASIVVVQEMRPGFTKLLARQLNGLSELVVDEAEQRQPLRAGMALLTPGHCCLSFERAQDSAEHMFVMKVEDVGESADRLRKRIDHAMISAAEQFGARAIGVLLTGVGDDGRAGMAQIRECGGKTLAQDESSSIVFDMPRAAIDAGVVDEVLPLWSISDRIIEIVGEG